MADNYVNLPIEGGSSSGVSSLNALTGALTLVAGIGINISILGSSITIEATGGGYVPDSRLINTTAPLAGGGNLSADLTLSIPAATSLVDGYLKATDWTTFNNKQDALTLPLSIANGGTGQITANAAFNALSPMTTGGDLIYGGASGAATRLANGNAGEVLSSNGTTLAPSWVTKLSLGAVTPTGSTLAARSGSGNLAANIFVPSVASVATAGGTTTLTVSSAGTQVFTGTTTQTCQLPVNSTMTVGSQFQIKNRSTGIVTVTSSGGNTVKALAANSSVILTLTTAVLDTTAAPWDVSYNIDGVIPIANGGTGQTTKAAAFDALSPMTTGGDLIYGGTSGTGTRLANGTSGQVLVSAGGTSAPAWTTSVVPMSTGPGTQAMFTVVNEDWITGAIAGSYGWVATASSGASTMNTTAIDSTHWGIAQISSGTASGNSLLLSLATARIMLGSANTVYWEANLQFTALSNPGVNTYSSRIGFFDNWSGAANNGIFFEYDTASSANWRYGTANGGSRTIVSSSTPVAAATWTKLSMKITSSSTEFFVDGVSIGTQSSTYPASVALLPAFGILKGATGASAGILLIDWCSIYGYWSGGR